MTMKRSAEEILKGVKTIAMVGASANPERPSYQVMAFMQKAGYRVIPVNPGLAGRELLGEAAFASLADITEQVDMVDVFRPAEACPAIAKDAVSIGASCLWLQEGIISDQAASIAEAAGLDVVMDLCPKKVIEGYAA